MQKVSTIYEKIPFKYLIAVCIFLLIVNVVHFFRYLYQGVLPVYPSFLALAIALLLLLGGIFSRYKTWEKIATILLGIAFVIRWIGDANIIPVKASYLSSVILIMLSMFYYWESYKIFNKPNYKMNRRIIAILLIGLGLIILPAVFFWLLGLLANFFIVH